MLKKCHTSVSRSFFHKINATDMGEMKVYRGKKNHKDLARLIAYNGDTGKFTFLFSFSETFFQQFTNKQLCCVLESDAWDEDECNQFVGTDTTIIPPLIAPEKGNGGSKGFFMCFKARN